MSKLGKKLIIAAKQGVEIVRGALEPNGTFVHQKDPRSPRVRNAEDTILELHAEIERLRAENTKLRSMKLTTLRKSSISANNPNQALTLQDFDLARAHALQTSESFKEAIAMAETSDFLKLYKSFTKKHWGPRCRDYDPGCACCQAWRRYDAEHKACKW